MPQTYYTILTEKGHAKLINALALGQSVNLSQYAVGTGENDGPYNPVETQTALKGEVWRHGINQIIRDQNDPTRMEIEAVIPQNVGNWTIRELGIFDSDNELFAVGNFPDTFKPSLGDGAAGDLLLRTIIKTGNADQVELKIDPSIVLATRSYVINALEAHSSDPNAHADFLRRNRTDTLEKGFWSNHVDVDIADGVAEIDPTLGNIFDFTANKTVLIQNMTTMPAGGMAIIYARQDATGNRAINFGSKYLINSGQINQSPNAVNIIYLTVGKGSEDIIDVHITQRASQ
ncbi:phage tail protein [Kiloniella litopenaei]|uniref:phage tail protein n=1 Tax=Kiloniella litopenaei TaxID=1549748 RepID=UPI003BA86D3F